MRETTDSCIDPETMNNKVLLGRYGSVPLRTMITFNCHRNVFHVNKSLWTLHEESFRVWTTCNVMYLNLLVKERILFFQQHSLDHLSVFGADRTVQFPGLHRTEKRIRIRTSIHCTIKREYEGPVLLLPVFQHCSSKQTVWTALGLNILRQSYCNTTSRGRKDTPLNKH